MAASVPQCTAVAGLMRDEIEDLQVRFAHQEVAIESLLPTNPEEYLPKEDDEGSEAGTEGAPAQQTAPL